MSRAQAPAPLLRVFSRLGRRRSKFGSYYYHILVWTTICENGVWFFFVSTNESLTRRRTIPWWRKARTLYVHIARSDNTRCVMRDRLDVSRNYCRSHIRWRDSTTKHEMILRFDVYCLYFERPRRARTIKEWTREAWPIIPLTQFTDNFNGRSSKC